MADYSRFPPDDASATHAAEKTSDSAEQFALPEQWAAMTFAPVSIDPGKFGTEWEQSRGAVARATIALLRLDDQALTGHFMEQPEPLRQAMELHAGLQREIEYLKTHMEALEMAATRVLCVASRLAEQSQS